MSFSGATQQETKCFNPSDAIHKSYQIVMMLLHDGRSYLQSAEAAISTAVICYQSLRYNFSFADAGAQIGLSKPFKKYSNMSHGNFYTTCT